MNDRLAPGERSGFPLVDERFLAIHSDFGLPIAEVDGESMRMPMSRLDASWWNVDLQHAHEGILERHLVGIRRNSTGSSASLVDWVSEKALAVADTSAIGPTKANVLVVTASTP